MSKKYDGPMVRYKTSAGVTEWTPITWTRVVKVFTNRFVSPDLQLHMLSQGKRIHTSFAQYQLARDIKD